MVTQGQSVTAVVTPAGPGQVLLPPDVLALARGCADAAGVPVADWLAGLIRGQRAPLSPAEKQRAYRVRKAREREREEG